MVKNIEEKERLSEYQEDLFYSEDVGGYVVPFLEGCCKTCKEDGKFCKKVTVRMTIRKNDCRSNIPEGKNTRNKKKEENSTRLLSASLSHRGRSFYVL
ncbi:hypothetical protein QYF61_004545 [Mycteria americana]|uniref:Uncharacterized protein n=1 Tax=Mycteria americana TaxID=33587 RepID=A0AAN7RVB3_MYCAM|nr:hypothetical protein QYF61_004545 [Mycteria americana]